MNPEGSAKVEQSDAAFVRKVEILLFLLGAMLLFIPCYLLLHQTIGLMACATISVLVMAVFYPTMNIKVT